MDELYKYLNVIEAPWHMRTKVVQLVDTIKGFLGKELKIKYIFISNWINDKGDEYIYGNSLWVFTESNIIRCIGFKDCVDPNKCELQIYSLGTTLFSQITSVNYSAAVIDIQLSNNDIAKFKAINGNLSYLINIYQDLFFKEVSL